jgi:hypothetical protein
VVVDNLDLPRLVVAPDKTDPPLVVDADAVLTLPVTVQRFQAIAGRHPQIVQQCGRIDRQQLGASPPLDLLRQVADGVASEDRRCAFVGKALGKA